MEYRIEHDSMGEVKVPADRYWACLLYTSMLEFVMPVGLSWVRRSHRILLKIRGSRSSRISVPSASFRF